VPKQVTNPGGPRHARADDTPLRGYRHDTLSGVYNTIRADHAAQARAASQAKYARARQSAARIVAAHSNTITVEDCSISTWARLWGKRIQLFSPGMIIAALDRECQASGGRLHRAGTRSTALSQHCPCGQRVPKTLAPNAPTIARHVGCAPIATSCPRRWPPVSISPTPTTPPPPGSITRLLTP
jgi:hypothetical protein